MHLILKSIRVFTHAAIHVFTTKRAFGSRRYHTGILPSKILSQELDTGNFHSEFLRSFSAFFGINS